MKNKQASVKEIVLLIILGVILLFYFVKQVPLQNWQNRLEEERAIVQSEIDTVQPMVTQMDVWQKELDEVYAKSNGRPKSIPNYPNINDVIAEMSMIFESAESYSITFSDPSLNDHIVTRSIRISFTCYQYDDMIERLASINESDNRYRITDLSIEQSTSDFYNVSFNMIAYEYTSQDSL